MVRLSGLTECSREVSREGEESEEGWSHLGRLHELLPVPLTYGRVLQLTHGSQGGQHVLDSCFQQYVSVPSPHLLVQSCEDKVWALHTG